MSTSMTPTALRKNLFQALRRVLCGERIVIETEEGDVLMSAHSPRRRRPHSRQDPGAAKITGRIIGSLETADAALRKHLRLPK